jgi:hypothetical protein
MLTCPLCKKSLTDGSRECPRCRADLSILVDYVGQLRDGLARAQEQTRKGELGEAIWAYLEVLEVDPDNAEARRQVSRVTTAVRQFDRLASGRRWLKRLERQARFRRWLASWQEVEKVNLWQAVLSLLVIGLLALFLGYQLGWHQALRDGRTEPASINQEP